MKTLACKDIDPSLNCDHVSKGEDVSTVLADMRQHLSSAHPEKVAQMQGQGVSEEDMVATVTPHIKDEEATM